MSRVKLKIDNKEKKEKEKKVKKDQSMSHTQNTHTSTYLLLTTHSTQTPIKPYDAYYNQVPNCGRRRFAGESHVLVKFHFLKYHYYDTIKVQSHATT